MIARSMPSLRAALSSVLALASLLVVVLMAPHAPARPLLVAEDGPAAVHDTDATKHAALPKEHETPSSSRDLPSADRVSSFAWPQMHAAELPPHAALPSTLSDTRRATVPTARGPPPEGF